MSAARGFIVGKVAASEQKRVVRGAILTGQGGGKISLNVSGGAAAGDLAGVDLVTDSVDPASGVRGVEVVGVVFVGFRDVTGDVVSADLAAGSGRAEPGAERRGPGRAAGAPGGGGGLDRARVFDLTMGYGERGVWVKARMGASAPRASRFGVRRLVFAKNASPALNGAQDGAEFLARLKKTADTFDNGGGRPGKRLFGEAISSARAGLTPSVVSFPVHRRGYSTTKNADERRGAGPCDNRASCGNVALATEREPLGIDTLFNGGSSTSLSSAWRNEKTLLCGESPANQLNTCNDASLDAGSNPAALPFLRFSTPLP
jgi:hypothetical protein